MGDVKFEAMLKKTVNPGKCRESLVGNEYLSDVTFSLGESGDELKAHKFFLMTASPVFHELFANNSDTSDGMPLDLKISAIAKPTMIEICRFAYSEVVNLTKENMLDVLFAASKFQMKFLMEKTIDFICKDGMNENSVYKILDANQKENNMRINIKCFEYIQKNHQKCFKSPDFLAVSSDLLRAIMQTCKIPRTAAKGAIALWSAFPDNSDDDLDELIALASLNDEVEEPNNNKPDVGSGVGSDCESVKSSRAGSAAGGNRQNRGKQQNNRGNFNDGKQQNSRGNFNDGNQQRRPPRNLPNMAHQQQFVQQQQQHILHQQTQMGFATTKNFFLKGSMSRRSGNFANLNLTTLNSAISISEIHFIYDLSATDKEFDLRIVDITGKKTDLFYCRVSTSDKFNGVFTRYLLPRPCQINSGRKIWISIEFNRSEHRLSYDNFNVAPEACKDRLMLRKEGSNSAQVISNIVFSDIEM